MTEAAAAGGGVAVDRRAVTVADGVKGPRTPGREFAARKTVCVPHYIPFVSRALLGRYLRSSAADGDTVIIDQRSLTTVITD